MKHLIALFAACLLSVGGMAQSSALVGTWQMLGSDGKPTTSVKVIMPDGKLLGLSYNNDFSNSSVWFMSNYKVLNDTSYVDHAFYHSSIEYQRDYFFTFHKESDSVLVSSYIDYRSSGVGVIMVERWKKMDTPMPVYSDAEWQALYQKSLAEFERLPKDGQTVEQYAQELYDKAVRYLNDRKPERGREPMLIRAELDTTNLQWQKDALEAYMDFAQAPAIAEKICNRFIRLTEAQAPVPTDSSVVKAYRLKALMYTYRRPMQLELSRQALAKVLELEEAGGYPPTRSLGCDYYNMALTYKYFGDFANWNDYAAKSFDISERSTDATNIDKADACLLRMEAMLLMDQLREVIDMALNQVAPLLINNQEHSQEALMRLNSAYIMAFDCYEQMIGANPGDKKLLKEYQNFMSDKMLVAVFDTMNKDLNLYGEYTVLERSAWTLEKPAFPSAYGSTHYLLQKGDEYVEFDVKDGEKVGARLSVIPVEAAVKKDVIKQWKAYKKNKKK